MTGGGPWFANRLPTAFSPATFFVLRLIAQCVGLALACVTNLSTSVLFPPEFFADPELSNVNFLTLPGSPTHLTLGSAPKELPHSLKSKGLSAFSIIDQMLGDGRLDPSKIRSINVEMPFTESLKNVGDIIRAYARLWIVPLSTAKNDKETEEVVRAKIEELQWLATLLFGLGGWRQGHKFRSDFFL
jgi:hypothetical protein